MLQAVPLLACRSGPMKHRQPIWQVSWTPARKVHQYNDTSDNDLDSNKMIDIGII